MQANKSVIRSAVPNIEEAINGTVGGTIANLVNAHGDHPNGIFELEQALRWATGAVRIVAVLGDNTQVPISMTPGAVQAAKRQIIQIALITRRQEGKWSGDCGPGVYTVLSDGMQVFSERVKADWDLAGIVAFSDAVNLGDLCGNVMVIKER